MKDETFIKRIESLKNKSVLNGSTSLLRFLTPHEQMVGKNIDRNIHYFGGYPNAEYKRGIVSAFAPADEAFNICAVHIIYNKRFLELTHKNILGTLLSLGITRDNIGDILPEHALFFCTKEIWDFISLEFKMINRVPISCELTNVESLNIEEKVIEKTIFVSSLRLDTIVSQCVNVSRTTAQTLISDELVKVNYQACKNYSYAVRKDDMISIRRKGRIRIIDILGETKKGHIALLIGLII